MEKNQSITEAEAREKYNFHKNNVHFDVFYEELVKNNFKVEVRLEPKAGWGKTYSGYATKNKREGFEQFGEVENEIFFARFLQD